MAPVLTWEIFVTAGIYPALFFLYRRVTALGERISRVEGILNGKK